MTDAWLLATDCSWPDRCDLTARLWAQGEPRRDAMATELREEVERRRATRKRSIARGAIDPAQAEHGDALLAAVADELAWHSSRRQGVLAAFPASPLPWSARLLALRELIARRRTLYPRWIANAGNRMTRAEAAERLWRLEGVHDYLWRDLAFFDPTDAAIRDDARHDWYAIMRERARLAEEREPEACATEPRAQPEMAL